MNKIKMILATLLVFLSMCGFAKYYFFTDDKKMVLFWLFLLVMNSISLSIEFEKRKKLG